MELAARRLIAGPHGADDRRQTRSRFDDFVQRVESRPHDVRIKKPVERGVALDRHFGKDDEVRRILLSLFDRAEDPRNVTFVIAVGRIDLSDGDAHLL